MVLQVWGLGVRLTTSPHKKIVTKPQKNRGCQGPPRAVELMLIIIIIIIIIRDGTVVKVLCYKSEGRWFDSRWCHWNFSLT